MALLVEMHLSVLLPSPSKSLPLSIYLFPYPHTDSPKQIVI